MVENEVFDIPDDDPFKNDKLGREPIADNLEKIIAATTGSLVLSIDAGWGNGKTTFINMWRKKLDNSEKYRTLHFNAWENDDCDDPLLALIGEIEEVLTKGNKYKGFVKNIKKYGKPLLKNILPSIIKVGTSGFINVENFNIDKITENQVVELAGKLGEFDSYKKQKNAKTKFKETLSEFQKSESKKIVFFIDELDRCRPTFAIETLEKIKHLFNIDEFIFVLALDRSQLAHSIKTLYGQDMDSAGYLRRFIDLEFTLPEPDRSSYMDILLKRNSLLRAGYTEYFKKYLDLIVEHYDLSLRDIEKLFYCLRIVLPTSPLLYGDKKYLKLYIEALGVVYAIFPVLKIKDKALYQKFMRKEQIDVVNINQEGNRYYSSIFSKVVALNIDLKKKEPGNLDFEKYYVGDRNDFRNENVSMTSLLDESRTEFSFIQQIEFVDNFTTPK